MDNTQNPVNASVVGVFPNRVEIRVKDIEDFKVAEQKLNVGSYLKVSDSDDCFIVAAIESFCIQAEEESDDRYYVLEAVPIGFVDSDGEFTRGGKNIAIPPTGVAPATHDDIQSIYKNVKEDRRFEFSSLAQDDDIRVPVDGDRFFNKHIAIVGSTGCGKSCAVASILQKACAEKTGKYSGLNNSHIVVFDLHGEYSAAFREAQCLDVTTLSLPCWLMNGDELEELFIETGENQAYNQANLLRRLVTCNKQKHNPEIELLFDTPVPFRPMEILNCLINLSMETRNHKKESEMMIVGGAKEFSTDEEKFNYYFEKVLQFDAVAPSKIKKGMYNDGTLEKFISRMRWKLGDKRLGFLLGEDAGTRTFIQTLEQLLSYKKDETANVTVIDLSGIPFEVLSITVSLITRLIFDYGYFYKRSFKPESAKTPLLLVYEEAHKYVPKLSAARYAASRFAIERIAKEGRKYGVSLALVTQRPSEISETIFSQCSNFVGMRLTNPEDQGYVKRLLPDSLGPLTDSLPNLQSGEAILIGDSVVMPSLVMIDLPSPEPTSSDVPFLQEWKRKWHDVAFKKITEAWTKR